MLSLVFAGACGYLLGSIPTAFLLVRWKSRVDIRTAGSGNVGTLNSYLVTRSRLVGLAVLLADMAKGAAAVVVGLALAQDFGHAAAGAVGAVLGHNFPVWLAFHGGRGLAPTAGAMLAISWPLVVLWCLLWTAGFLLTRHINAANAFASLLTLISMVFLPLAVAHRLVPLRPTSLELSLFAILLLGIVLVKHVQPVREYIEQRAGGQ